jgi:hypothetical protein
MPSLISPPVSPAVFAVRRGLIGLLLLLASPVVGADDLYLSEIEEEAKRQAATLITQPTAPSAATAPDAAADRLAPGLDGAAFARALRAELPGTFVLYQRLDPAHQRQVYEAYRRDNRLASISAQVARLSGGGS